MYNRMLNASIVNAGLSIPSGGTKSSLNLNGAISSWYFSNFTRTKPFARGDGGYEFYKGKGHDKFGIDKTDFYKCNANTFVYDESV